MQTIPFYEPSIGSEEINEVVDCLKSGWLTTGPRVKQFEEWFGRYVQQPYAVAVNSCTAALHLALEAIGLKEGQCVVVPTMTFAATAEVVRYFGATPTFVDCRDEDLNLDVADAERRIEAALMSGGKVSAIMPVHYGGQVGDVSGVMRLAERYNLKIVEDAAHCCPAYYKEAAGSEFSEWRPVGYSSDVVCFSFYANKCITTGEGGMACTKQPELAERIRIMALHGISKDAWKRYTAEGSWSYEIIAPGYKYNMTDVAAALGLRQLQRAEELHRKRREIAALYTSILSPVEEIILPSEPSNRISSWHLYPIRLRLDRLSIDRARFIEELKRRGVGASVHWMPLHMHPYYRQKYGYQPDEFPVAANAYAQLVSLPIFPGLGDGKVAFVADAIKDTIARYLLGRS